MKCYPEPEGPIWDIIEIMLAAGIVVGLALTVYLYVHFAGILLAVN